MVLTHIIFAHRSKKFYLIKSFASKIQTDAIPDDYCDALTVNVIKASSLLKNKLKVELKNCRNQVVWTAEGTGYSKEYPEGYAEAFADALSGLEKLPDNAMAGRATATNLQSTSEVISEKDVTNYKPRNPYYNSTYFVDLTSGEGGILNLIIINGKLLGYKDLQVIGTLTPTGLENVYSLNWVDANGDQLTGVANLSDTELKISLPSGSTATVITLKKL